EKEEVEDRQEDLSASEVCCERHGASFLPAVTIVIPRRGPGALVSAPECASGASAPLVSPRHASRRKVDFRRSHYCRAGAASATSGRARCDRSCALGSGRDVLVVVEGSGRVVAAFHVDETPGP